MDVPYFPELECTIDEGWHKTYGKQPEQVACLQCMVLFLISYSDQEINKTLCALRALAVQHENR
jgi:hypothetical protein